MTTPFISVTDKRIVLTGALGYLGSAMAKALTDAGATLFLIDLAQKEKGEAQLKEKEIAGTYFQCDITNEGALARVAKEVGTVDVLINNAAFNPRVEDPKHTTATFLDYPLDRWEEELRVNLTGTMLASRAFRKNMRQYASIINISSIYSLVAPDQRIYPPGFEKPAVYGASKAAVLNLTKHLASLWGKDGIRVNAVVYGGVENNQDAEFVRKYSERVPLGRMARIEDIPGVIMFLASDASKYATGGTFVIDGGWTAW